MGPLETIQDGLNKWLHEVQVHLKGKGITSGAVIIAGVLSPVMPFIVPFTIALCGVGAHMFYRLREQWSYQDAMADRYRDVIADRLGIAPSEVTREHAKIAAYGNEQEGIDGNPILAQALDRQRNKSWLVFGTALVAAAVTFMLLSSGAGLIAGGMLEALPILQNVPIIPNVIGMFGGAVVAGLSSLLVQDGLEMLIGNAKGINAPSAHDRILAIEARQARNKSVTPEQIFQVKLIVAPELEARVEAMTGKKFGALKADMQERVLARIDPKGEMLMIAEEINKKHIDAKDLTFILTGQQTVRPADVEKGYAEDTGRPRARSKPSFTERLGFKHHDEAASHAERIDESRVIPIEAGRA